MRDALEALRSKRRYREIHHAKLARILECAELNVPESWPGIALDPRVMAGRRRSLSQRARAAARIPKKARWALVPAGVAASIIVLVLTGTLDFMRAGRSGSAGIVSGDVTVSRGGGERVLRAGDPVSGGDVVVAGAGSSAEIQFTNLLRMRILGGSRVALRTITLNGRERVFDALVTGGGCVLDVSRLGRGDSVSVHTPASVAVVRGTRFGVMVDGRGGVRFEVYEGRVRVRRCLPADMPADTETAKVLDRYFRDHALEVSRDQACAIGVDPVQLESITGMEAVRVMATLKLPVPVRGMTVMRDDMDRLVKSSSGSGVKFDAAGRDARMKPSAGRDAAPGPGNVFLMYIPVLDSVIKIGNGRLMSIRSNNVQWSVPLDVPILSYPVHEEMSLYIAAGTDSISRFDLLTGGTRWRVRIPGGRTGSATLKLDGSGIYCATSGGTLCKIDRGGGVVWSVKTDEIISTVPVIADNLVFISTRKGSLFGFDKSSGLKVIRVSIRGSIVSIAAGNREIYIATDAGRLYCYNYGDDEMLWEYQVNDAIACDMAVTGHSVYLFGRSGRIHRISDGGDLVWSRDIGIPIMQRPSEDAASFYVPASETLFVVDKMTGDVTWSLLLPRITSSNVVVSKGHIYFETGKKRLSSLKK